MFRFRNFKVVVANKNFKEKDTLKFFFQGIHEIQFQGDFMKYEILS